MFDLDNWLRSQTKFSLDYLRLGRKVAKITCLETGENYKVKWSDSAAEAHLLQQESLWLSRLFRKQKYNVKMKFKNDVFYIFDFHKGDDLSELLALNDGGGSKIDSCDVNNIAYLLFKEVVKLHELGVVHGDLKPQNILYSNDNVRMIDFGSAGWIGGAIFLKRAFSYSQYYSLPNILSYRKCHIDFDWYAFFLVLSVLYNRELASLKLMSPAEFNQTCMGFIDNMKLEGQDKLILEQSLSSIIHNQVE